MLKKGIINISGISESRSAYIADKICKEEGQGLIVVASETRAKRLASDLSFFASKNIYTLPAEDEIFLRYEAKNHDRLMERLKILKALRTGEDCIVVAPVSAAIKKITPHSSFEEKSFKISQGDNVDLGQARESLVAMGYERADIIDTCGQFCMRGGIVDVWPPDASDPYRIELFDTEVDSIRTFDVDTQRSIENLKYVEIYPAEQVMIGRDEYQAAADRLYKEYTAQIKRFTRSAEKLASPAGAAESKDAGGAIVSEGDLLSDDESKARGYLEAADNLTKRRDELCEYIRNVSNVQLLENYLQYFYQETEYLWDYMEGGTIMVDDPERIYEFLDNRSAEVREDLKVMLDRGRIVPKDMELVSDKLDFYKIYQQPLVYVISPFPKAIKGIEKYTELKNIQSRQMVTFNGHMDLLETELKSYVKKQYIVYIVCSTKERIDNLKEFTERAGIETNVIFRQGALTAGMDFPEEKICYISENDIFAAHKAPISKRRPKTKGQKIQSFADMSKGDYVVHENHGIGKFLGIEQLNVQGEKKDYLKIKYAGNDMLYVPVEQMDIVQKYIGSDGTAPKINKLSGGDWKVTKAKAKTAIAHMAKELLELYASRSMEKGHAFGTDTVWQMEFEDSFPYTETDDQLQSISEIKSDMERPVAMDRLLCGDVGFGKTEVAARAIFKCLAEGKQAAILVPTTILANQHYYTLKDRFEKFPFTVEMLSRFRSDAQQAGIIEALSAGSVDLVIGTHRLLSADVQFKDLGLLVIDEEQRFGVAHKEKIKQMKKNVDVLTLSATPIPRTLNMSLTGIKDMSLIEEPPEERYPVQTYVMEQDDSMIRDIISRELERGGQAFVVFNRVKGIQKIGEKIATLVPSARVAVGHGQMNERMLEDIMLGFINGESNVLVSTTIIESGIDIPNANTMLILDADRFGLSQLYQLRGRVGRSNRMAYAYLMYQKDKVLSEVAEKRLKAIKEFTEFGAGFKVAMRDLEIRGAGNLLGSEQSGHMMSIGYELYCKLVDDAVRSLQGEIINENKEETSVELAIRANIPNYYIENETLKLQMYKKIAGIKTEEDEDEIIDELMDRFGDVPRETLNLVRISRIRTLAGDLSVTRIFEESFGSGAGASIGARASVSAGKGAGSPARGRMRDEMGSPARGRMRDEMGSPARGRMRDEMGSPARGRMRDEMGKVVISFDKINPLNPFALANVNDAFGPRAFVHGGVEPFIRLTVKDKLADTVKLLEILNENKKSRV